MNDAPGSSKAMRSTGWILTGLVIIFMLMDSGTKLASVPHVLATMEQLGWPPARAFHIGVVLLFATILYAIPRTAVLGAILLTAHLGGAVATHLRIGNPLFTHLLFPVYIGILVWGALWFRDPGLRQLLPWRRDGAVR